jgi:hypothetical protein
MKRCFSIALLLLLVSVCAQTFLAETPGDTLAARAMSNNSAESQAAIAALRALGPSGLDRLFKTYAREINEQVTNPLLPASPEWQRLSAALDAVGQQKDAYLSGLYWYTDLREAQVAASASSKPILSLRLLGKLSEEYSCANSRFFRTILYSNAEVSKTLREHFILHWESERPAPRVTIDFGDGRKLERTLTGNSIHYVLDSRGRVIDALLGLYGPRAFLRSLSQIEAAAKAPEQQANHVTATPYPMARLNAINVGWYSDIQKIGGKAPQGFFVAQTPDGTPTAIQVAALAMTKRVTEANILRSITATPEALSGITDESLWNKIAQLHIADAELDARSLGLIRRQTQGALSATDEHNEQAFAALVKKLQQNIALDTVRNEYLLHTKLYGWFLDKENRELNQLNRRVYSELFLTPASDPWLGLFSPDVYTALEGGGLSHK